MRLHHIALLLAFLFAVSFVHEASAKTFKVEISLKEFVDKKSVYIGRFGINTGAGDASLRIRYHKPVKNEGSNGWTMLTFYGIFDEHLERHRKETQVCEQSRGANFRLDTQVPEDGSWSDTKKSLVKQFARTRLYHFFLQDCMNQLMPQHIKNLDEPNVMEIIFDIKNTDGSELSQEENGLLLPHLVMTLVFFFFFSNTLFTIIKFYKKEETVDYPMLVLDAACFLEFLSLLMETLHLLTQSYFGESTFGVDFLGWIFSLLAQFTMTLLLIMIATGWSITYGNIEDLDLLVPLGALVAILHIVIGVVSRIGDDASKMHDYDGWAGVVLVIIRIVFFGVFVAFAVNTLSKAQKKIQGFVVRIMLIGTVYLLTIPVVVTIATMFVDFLWRHWVITLFNMVLQSVTVMMFAFQFSAKSSSYNAVSIKNSIWLPTAKAD